MREFLDTYALMVPNSQFTNFEFVKMQKKKKIPNKKTNLLV